METKKTSFRLDDETLVLLTAIAKRKGISKTAALKVLIREQARRMKVEIKP